MRLNTVDIVILVVYFLAMISVGIYVTRRASKNLDSYFLGGKTMPWWLLGISNASAMWDVTGTMWFVYILFTYGMKAVFLPWLWPAFNQIFEAIGFWKPVYLMVKEEDAVVQLNEDAARDLTNCAVGVVWQLMLVTIPLYIIFRNLTATLLCVGILIATTIFLKVFWYDHLERDQTIADAGRNSETAQAFSR